MRHFRYLLAATILGLSSPPARADPPAPQVSSAVLSKCLAAAEQQLGRSDPKLLPMLASLARLRFQDADMAASMALRRRSLKIAIAAYGSQSVPAAEAMAALAHLYIELRRYLDAEPLAIAADNVLSARPGGAGSPLAAVLADRARIALARGDNGDARQWAEAAIAIDDKSAGAARSDRLRVLGAVLMSEGRFAESERVLRQALVLDQAGGDRLATARSLAQFGKAYLRQKRYAEALPLAEEAAAIDQQQLGSNASADRRGFSRHRLDLSRNRARRRCGDGVSDRDRPTRARRRPRYADPRLYRARPRPGRASAGARGQGSVVVRRRPPHSQLRPRRRAGTPKPRLIPCPVSSWHPCPIAVRSRKFDYGSIG